MSQERHDRELERRSDNEGLPPGQSDPPGELPPELRPLEARLAALCPRSESLDHELVMFQAGQASVATVRRTPIGWPVSLAAMTTVAAALLVMLLVDGGTTQPRGGSIAAPSNDDGAGTENGTDVDTRIVEAPREAGGQPAGPPTRPADRFGFLDPLRVIANSRPRSMQLEIIDRLLKDGGAGEETHDVSTAAPARTEEPVPYRERLKALLDDQV